MDLKWPRLTAYPTDHRLTVSYGTNGYVLQTNSLSYRPQANGFLWYKRIRATQTTDFLVALEFGVEVFAILLHCAGGVFRKTV